MCSPTRPTAGLTVELTGNGLWIEEPGRGDLVFLPAPRLRQLLADARTRREASGHAI